ncbi:MAG: toll/interleukin-1 receptor domain-containing protein [Candidatus Paceibacterota bacterium]
MDLFISHAKRDGLPLANAIQTQLKSVPHATAFYDDKSLMLSEDWKRQLEAGVASSVTVFLRTDAFDDSHYCRTEAIWGDQYGCPALVVDVRRGLSHHPGLFDLPLGNLPTVRAAGLKSALHNGLLTVLIMGSTSSSS